MSDSSDITSSGSSPDFTPCLKNLQLLLTIVRHLEAKTSAPERTITSCCVSRLSEEGGGTWRKRDRRHHSTEEDEEDEEDEEEEELWSSAEMRRLIFGSTPGSGKLRSFSFHNKSLFFLSTTFSLFFLFCPPPLQKSPPPSAPPLPVVTATGSWGRML